MKTAEILETSKTSYQDLVIKAYDIQGQCKDYLVKNAGQNTFMDPVGNLHFMPETDSVKAEHKVMAMSSWALGQLSGKTGISRKYIEKCFEHGKGDLAARNINSWLNDLDGIMKVRTYREQIRGIVSGRYADYDAPYLLDGLFDGILDESEWNVKGSFINEERLHIRMTQNEPMKLDGGLFPAIFIDSSDVGRSALRIMFGIFRVACTNGLIIPAICTQIHQRHIGINKEDLLKIVAESIRNIPVMMDNAQDLIRYAADQKIQMVTPNDLEVISKRLKDLASISEEESNQIVRIVHEKYWENHWGLVNGITEFAQSKSLERRLELEEAAGRLLAAA